jgi:hypothetical protein
MAKPPRGVALRPGRSRQRFQERSNLTPAGIDLHSEERFNLSGWHLDRISPEFARSSDPSPPEPSRD